MLTETLHDERACTRPVCAAWPCHASSFKQGQLLKLKVLHQGVCHISNGRTHTSCVEGAAAIDMEDCEDITLCIMPSELLNTFDKSFSTWKTPRSENSKILKKWKVVGNPSKALANLSCSNLGCLESQAPGV